MNKEFEPQLVSVIREGYTLRNLWSDAGAGLITGIIALPLAVAFAIASGVSPQQGLYTAIIAGFIISALGGSRYQIGGPTGAFIVIVYGIVHQHGPTGLAIATLIAGVMLIAMGVMQLGSIIKYIPYPVTLGFTSGIALLIATTQVSDFMGLTLASSDADFVPRIQAIVAGLGTFNVHAAIVATCSLVVLGLWPRVSTRIPASLLVIVATTVIAKAFDLPVETIGDRFGDIAGSLPAPHPPQFSINGLRPLLAPALTIAMLGAIESLLSAVVADGMTGSRHRSNMELIAQGVANLVTPLFGGIPATGAIARTAANIRNGAFSPISGIIHAGVLLLVLLCFGRLASLIPLACLSAILMHVAFKMAELHGVIRMFRTTKSGVILLVTTFLLTVFFGLTISIPFGMIAASFLFMKRMEQISDVRNLDFSEDDGQAHDDPLAISRFYIPKGVEVFEVNGPFFFGMAAKFQDAISGRQPRVLVLRLRNVPAIDSTGIITLEKIIDKSRKHGRDILLSGLNKQPRSALQHAGVIDLIGEDHLHADINSALEHAVMIVGRHQINQKA